MWFTHKGRETTTNTYGTLSGTVSRIADKHSRFGSYRGVTVKLDEGGKAWFKRSRDASFELNVGDHVEVTGNIELVNDLKVVNQPIVHADLGDYGVGHDSHADEGWPTVAPAITPSACLHIDLRRVSQNEQLYVCLQCRYLFRSADTWKHADEPEPDCAYEERQLAKPAEQEAKARIEERAQSYSEEKDAFLSQFLT